MKGKLYKSAILFLILIVVAFGIFFARQQRDFNNKKSESTARYVAIKNYEEKIYIFSSKDIENKRNSLIDYIWKTKGFPQFKIPSKIDKDVKDNRYQDLINLKKIEKIVTVMDYGVNSIAYLFHPIQTNNSLIIYNQGHDGDFIQGKDTINFFLSKGYSVLAFSMPLLGMNNQPTLEISPFGKIKLTPIQGFRHDVLQFLQAEEFSPIKFFLEPIAVSLNYVEKAFNFRSISMIGLSGGGWTTTLYAAIDPRISKSYPVAGTLPIYLRSLNPNDFGDYEQMMPELYRIANYLELYILGSYGKGRKQFQILNKYDNCCFAGDGYKTYEEEIRKLLFRVKKGEFAVYLDDSHKEHKISEKALQVIISDLGNKNIYE